MNPPVAAVVVAAAVAAALVLSVSLARPLRAVEAMAAEEGAAALPALRWRSAPEAVAAAVAVVGVLEQKYRS